MNFCDINPFIRFAEKIHYESSGVLTYVLDCRIFYILSGFADICIDNQLYTLKPHSIFYCCGGNQYSIASSGVDLISLNFDLSQENNTEDAPYSPVVVSNDTVLPSCNYTVIDEYEYLNSHLILSDGMVFNDQLNSILDEFSTQRILYKEHCSGLLKTVLTQLYRHSIESTDQSTRSVYQVIAYINTNYEQELNNKLFSEMTGYHEYHLNRLFTTHTGITLHQYILNVRINHAKKLLLNTDLPLATIAEEVGFNSNTHFSSYFKKITKISPLEFRNKYRNSI